MFLIGTILNRWQNEVGRDVCAAQNVGGTSQSIQEVLAEVDKDGDGRIDYEEFCTMMRGNDQSDGDRQPPLAKSGTRKGAY